MTDRIPSDDFQGEQYKGYRPVVEFGCYCWYRTTSTYVYGVNRKTNKEQRAGSRMNRVVTNAVDLETAKAHLDHYLSHVPVTKAKLSEIKAGPNQMRMDLDGE